MKLHTPPKPIDIVRLTFRKKDHDFEYIMLDDTSIEEVELLLKTAIQKRLIIDPFYVGPRIGIDIRRYTGAKAGKSKSISFKHEITPEELKTIILNELNELK